MEGRFGVQSVTKYRTLTLLERFIGQLQLTGQYITLTCNLLSMISVINQDAFAEIKKTCID